MLEVSAEVQCEAGSLTIVNYIGPYLYHNIKIKPRNGEERSEKMYDAPGKVDWSSCVVFFMSKEK